MDKARQTHRKVNLYAWLGGGVCVGLAVALSLAFWDTKGPGLVGFGTAMVMIGTALAVLAVGLVAALFSARSALTAVESYSELLASQSARHADELAQAQAERDGQQDHALDALSTFGTRQANNLLAVQATEERDHKLVQQEIVSLRAHGTTLADRLAHDERSSAEQIARLEDRVATARAAARRELERAEASEKELKVSLDRASRRTHAAMDDMRTDRDSLQRAVAKVLAEERERKAEFEALAGEEIRLMGRVRRTEALARGEPERMGEYYRISRPKGTHRGPFGEIYPIGEVEGISPTRAQHLREFGISNTEHLWRANPAFVASLLHCGAKDVEVWQEEAELMAINGIGRERAKVLVEAGVTSLEKLGHLEPDRLVKMVGQSEAAHGDGAAAGVTAANVAKWIEAAHRLRPTP